MKNENNDKVRQLRTELFNLMYKEVLCHRNMTTEEFRANKEDIKRLKKEMGKVIYLSNQIKGERQI